MNSLVLGHGEARADDGQSYRRQMLSTVRYADPAAWSVVAAVGKVIAGSEELISAHADNVAVISTSTRGTRDTIGQVASAVGEGMVSPLRFPAANPGSLAGLTSIAFHLHGPTLNFTMDPASGVPVALVVADRWITQQVAPLVLLAACTDDSDGEPLARCVLIASPELRGEQDPLDRRAALKWLTEDAFAGRPTSQEVS